MLLFQKNLEIFIVLHAHICYEVLWHHCHGIPSFSSTKIFVNGNWVGIHREPEHLMTTLRRLRRQMDIIVSEVSLFVSRCSTSSVQQFKTMSLVCVVNWQLFFSPTQKLTPSQTHSRYCSFCSQFTAFSEFANVVMVPCRFNHTCQKLYKCKSVCMCVGGCVLLLFFGNFVSWSWWGNGFCQLLSLATHKQAHYFREPYQENTVVPKNNKWKLSIRSGLNFNSMIITSDNSNIFWVF